MVLNELPRSMQIIDIARTTVQSSQNGYLKDSELHTREKEKVEKD